MSGKEPRPANYNAHLNRWRVRVDGKLMYRYRWVMEQHLGRPLRSDEHVHHVNGDSADDRIENLELIDIRAHNAIHARLEWQRRKAAWKYEWSQEHSRCVECGTTERKHQGHGQCTRCYSRLYWRAQRDREMVAA